MNDEDLLKIEKIIKLADDPLGFLFMDLKLLSEKLIELEKEHKLTAKDVLFIKEKLFSQELLNEIAKRVKPAGKGEPGDNYILTDSDREDIAQKIKPVVVEKIIEIQKTETIIEKPIVTEIIKEVAISESAEVIKNKIELELILEELRQEFEKKIIENTPKSGKGVGGIPGLLTYVGGAKKGFLKGVNYVAGSGITLSHSIVNGLDTITFTSTGGSSANSVFNEVVSFSGTTGTLANTPIAGTVVLYRNGSRQFVGITNDYTISGTTITLINAALVNDVFLADYQK